MDVFEAIENDDVEKFKELTSFEERSNPKYVDRTFRNDSVNVFKLLLENPQTKIDNGNLLSSFFTNCINIFKLLLEDHRIDINYNKYYIGSGKHDTILHITCYRNKVNFVKEILKHPDLDVNIKNGSNHSALSEACDTKSRNQIIKLLLKHPNIDVNISCPKGSPLILAIKNNYTQAVSLLLKHPNININKKEVMDQNTALLTALIEKNTELAELLLQHPDINVNLQNKFGLSPLLSSSRLVETHIFESLLKRSDIDVNIQNGQGTSVLHLICELGKVDFVKLLLSKSDIDVNIRSNTQNTPLHYISRTGRIYIDIEDDESLTNNKHMQTLNLLLQRKDIDVNIKNEDNESPLYIACKLDTIGVIITLLKHPKIKIDFNVLEFYEKTKIYFLLRPISKKINYNNIINLVNEIQE
jgi:ankyrin repeat protein